MCDVCGVPQPGVAEDGIKCDECLQFPRKWDRGRAALSYADNGRSLVLALKHGDRYDVARTAGTWMARAAEPLLTPNTLIVPVPLHWTRLAKRRYNQSALLAKSISDTLGLPLSADLLQRPQRTENLYGKDYEKRKETVDNAIRVNPRKRRRIAAGRPVLLVDDVLTSGATLNACAEALKASRAGEVSVIVLARAARRT